jgi:hypothetical protein
MLDRADIICLNSKAPDNINLLVVDLTLLLMSYFQDKVIEIWMPKAYKQ